MDRRHQLLRNGWLERHVRSGADPSAELYDESAVPRFDIELPQASIDALAADPDTYVRGTLRYGNAPMSEIGVRIQGEASLRTLDEKAAFKLKFDEFIADQSFRGLRRMTLNNMVSDLSFLAERLAYHVYRAAKLPAPRCSSALVYVNGKAFGVYANLETEDKTFLRRWFASDDGNLYEEGQRDFAAVRDVLVQADPRKEYSQQEFESAYQSVLSTIRGRAAAMRAELGN